MLKTYKNSKGEKLYPVCSWQRNQHKVYNLYTIAKNHFYDGGSYEDVEKASHVCDVFDTYVINGIVYATYKDSILIKKCISLYDYKKSCF